MTFLSTLPGVTAWTLIPFRGAIQSSCILSSLLSGGRCIGAQDKQKNIRLLLQFKQNELTQPHAKVQMIDWEQIHAERDDKKAVALKVRKGVNKIKSMLVSKNDGEISISAYDTAWVALVEDLHGSGAPHFPSSLQWVVENQLPDGSWGDRNIFSAHDRIINTLACVIALETWNIYPGKCEKGLAFIHENMCKIEHENTMYMPIGFEVVFPSLIDIAQWLDLEVPHDSPAVQNIYAKRNLKLTRIPKEMMHKVPTILLYSLEGMPDLDWKKLLKLQCQDGSFLFSPSSTAFAFMQTKDEKCLQYLQNVVQRFNGGVPNVYPVDLFEHIWAVDRLERLGISRYLQSEIENCMNYVYRYWTESGICWASNSKVHDIDDTAMGFRLLRLHGHDVSADVFRHFEKEGEFICYHGQSSPAVTGMFNLYRASHVSFPGETILQEAKSFSSKFLRKKQASNQLLDKWIITKDLPGEVGYALDVPWYASLPRIETRFYVKQYGGENDVWIGKTLYRMSNVNNNIYLELAKLDFNNCQELHQLEWIDIQKWYKKCNLELFGVDRRKLLLLYFTAMASIFEPERWSERLAWTQTAILLAAVSWYFEGISVEQQQAFIQVFINSCDNVETNNYNNIRRRKKKKTTTLVPGNELIQALVCTINQHSLVSHGREVPRHLQRYWVTFLLLSKKERQHYEAYLLVQTITLCAHHSTPLLYEDQIVSHPQLSHLVSLTKSLSHQLLSRRHLTHESNKVHTTGIDGAVREEDMDMLSIESNMQELVKCVVRNSEGINRETKKIFLDVVKSYFYIAYCSPEIINLHIAKVLFERIV